MTKASAPASKRCPTCGKTKPLDLFARDRTRKDGRSGACKACRVAQTRAWQRENPENVRAASRAYRKANPEKVRESVRAWQIANPEKVREMQQVSAARRRARRLETKRKLATRRNPAPPEAPPPSSARRVRASVKPASPKGRASTSKR